jgi:hypothetical protein
MAGRYHHFLYERRLFISPIPNLGQPKPLYYIWIWDPCRVDNKLRHGSATPVPQILVSEQHYFTSFEMVCP